MIKRLLATGLIALFVSQFALATEFETVFNGKDLSGWKGLDGFWSVQDGAIVGETTADKKIEKNTFLVWQGGKVSDFEFTATVRFKGNNSGVQYRSQFIDEPMLALKGYQLDLHPTPRFFWDVIRGKYDGRGMIATRGQRVEVDADGTVKQLGKVGSDDEFIDWQWNKIRIVAVGSRLIHQVNGITTTDVVDHHKDAMATGVLGLQLHRGSAMRCEFKDLRLHKLDALQGQQLLSTIATNETASPSGALQVAETEKATSKKASMKASKKADDGAGKRTTNERGLSIVGGFKVETVYSVPKETQGSWVALTIDDQGRMITSDQDKLGLYRVTIKTDGPPKVEKLPIELSGAQGLGC